MAANLLFKLDWNVYNSIVQTPNYKNQTLLSDLCKYNLQHCTINMFTLVLLQQILYILFD